METIFTIDIKSSVTKSVLDVFDTMLSFQLESVPDVDVTDLKEMRIVGSVNFAGQVSGIIHIHVNKDFAVIMTSAMLGMTPDEIEGDDEIKDVISELSNIIGGNLKSFFNDSGFYCALSTPSITLGDDFTIKSLNTERYESLSFSYQQHTIRIEVGVKLQGGYKAEEPGQGSELPAAARVDASKIRNLDLATKVPDSVINVFNTMLSMDVQISREILQSALEGMRTVGAVSFAGDAMGLINIHVTSQFSRQMTAVMLDMDINDVDVETDVNDVIGELSNIVGGNLKSIFSDVGLRCELSTPSITRGSDFRIESMNMERYERFAFSYQDHVFFVEFGLKLAEGLNIPLDDGKEINYQVVDENPPTPAEWPDLSAKPDKPDSLPGEIETPVSRQSEQPEEKMAVFQQKNWVDEPKASSPVDVNLSFLLDIPLEVSIELGRTRMKINELLKIREQSVVGLSTLADEPVDILVNNKLIAKGEVVVEGGKYGIRVIEVLSREDRIKSLR
ncbi:MAG: flagellar motor switch protein FliN [Deltaproteobacteria bacterium]|nr:flagellar motor switch protein FliN [Deltaproteobacteria bacterium]